MWFEKSLVAGAIAAAVTVVILSRAAADNGMLNSMHPADSEHQLRTEDQLAAGDGVCCSAGGACAPFGGSSCPGGTHRVQCPCPIFVSLENPVIN